MTAPHYAQNTLVTSTTDPGRGLGLATRMWGDTTVEVLWSGHRFTRRESVNDVAPHVPFVDLPTHGTRPYDYLRGLLDGWNHAARLAAQYDARPDAVDAARSVGHPANLDPALYRTGYRDGILRHADGVRRPAEPRRAP